MPTSTGPLQATSAPSSTPSTPPLNYTWTVGGATIYGAIVTVNPTQGDLVVVLAVRGDDNVELTTTVTQTISVPNAPPTLSTTIPNVVLPTGAALGLVITSSDIDGTVASTFIDFRDGTNSSVPADGATHVYSHPGTYLLLVRVTDNLGATNETNISLTVTNREPSFGSTRAEVSGTAGTALTLDASSASDPEGGALTVTWDFGDGTTATGATVNHTYDKAGNYNALVTITDENGGTQTQTVHVTVAPKPGSAPPSGDSLWWLPWLIIGLIALFLIALLARRRRKDEPEKPKESAKSEEAKGDDAPPAKPPSS